MTNAACFKDNAETKALMVIGKALDGLTLAAQDRLVSYFSALVAHRAEREHIEGPATRMVQAGTFEAGISDT